ncbi:hypothetical protein NHQ30_002725 [Ciborinia camelliae]|nr:hypothetical protein NHQ30_002725 [Ciborinia camelliae]
MTSSMLNEVTEESRSHGAHLWTLSNNNRDSGAIPDTLNSQNHALELKPSHSDVEEAGDGDLSFIDNEFISKDQDGPLLLTLLMGNNNNNAVTQDMALADTLNPQNYALELKPPRNQIEEPIDGDASIVKSDGEGGTILLGLRLNNQNNNDLAAAVIAPVSGGAIPDTLDPRNNPLELKLSRSDSGEILNNYTSSDNGEDGPIVLGLLAGQRNQPVPVHRPDVIPDTLDPRTVALEFKPSQNDAGEVLDDVKYSENGEDGPIILALMAGQQNTNIPRFLDYTVIVDTLDPRNVAFELKHSQDNFEEAPVNSTSSANAEDGPLLFAMLLGNQNNNNGSNGSSNANATDVPIADTLHPRNIALELSAMEGVNVNDLSVRDEYGPLISRLLLGNQNNKNGCNGNNQGNNNTKILESNSQVVDMHSPSFGDTITEVIPDVVEMKSQFLELPLGDNITETIPVVFKWKSQVLQGRLVPVREPTKSFMENSIHHSPDKAPVVNRTTLQPEDIGSVSKSVASDESNKGRLSDEQLQFWRDNGYLVIPNAMSGGQTDVLLKTVHEAAETLARGGERVQKHSYLPGEESYVHPSGRAIATLTEYAFKPNIEPLKRIQRLGCGIHCVMPAFRKAIINPFHSALAKSLGYKDPRIIQSLIIVKAAEVGARVIPHQDGCSGFTDPSSCTTFWYALEDCTTENGCLAVAPGSHRVQPITRRCRADAKGRPEFADLDTPVFARIENVSDTSLPRKNENGGFGYKKLEVKAGTLVLMHGNLMHTSEANYSSKSRVAFNFGVVEGQYEWLEDNYLQPPEGEKEFDKLM